VTHRREGLGLDVSGLALLGELAELVGGVLAHAGARQLSAADPQPEIDGLMDALARIEEPGAGDRHAPVPTVARWLADDLGLGEPDRIELELAAQLHDIGNLRLPFRLVHKSGALTPSEEELLRLQPLWGAEMVARIPGLEAVALIVRHCHESWDGRGYPDGLAGERTPLASRIIAVADAFSSMTVPRADRCALDPATALRELDALAGTSFDPDLTARLAGGVRGAEVRLA
jgi:HD-GYP domain-containing protein (c-di-GMP phosphodiesterase class II)